MKLEEVSQFLNFNPETGVFTWKKVSSKKIKVGDVAGWKTVLGYRAVVVCGKQVYCHRLAWLFTYGEMPKQQVDHINGVRDDNRPCNLRDISNCENHQNIRQPRQRKYGKGLAGAAYDAKRGLWNSRIRYDGRNRHLGRFATEEEAHEAYLKAKREHHPFSNLERLAHEAPSARWYMPDVSRERRDRNRQLDEPDHQH